MSPIRAISRGGKKLARFVKVEPWAKTSGSENMNPSSNNLLLDALLNWGVPLSIAGGIGVFALLVALDWIAPFTAIGAVSGLLLALIVYFPLRKELLGPSAARARYLVAIFAIAWIGIVWAQFYFAIFLGREMLTASLAYGGPGVAIGLEGRGRAYDLVVQGTLAPVSGQVAREAIYRLALEKDGEKVEEFEGTFAERWSRQRLGRRGTTSVHQLYNRGLHRFRSRGPGTYRLRIVSVSPELAPTLNVALYRKDYPQITLGVLSGLLLIGAYLLEIFREQNPPFLLPTSFALVFAFTLRHIGVPSHGYQDLIGAGLIALVTGPAAGALLRSAANFSLRHLGLLPRLRRQGSQPGKRGR